VKHNELGVLRGAEEIAEAIGTTPRRVYHLVQNGQLPATREGSLLVTTMQRLREFYGGSENNPAAKSGSHPD
jgi:hypothetical protein